MYVLAVFFLGAIEEDVLLKGNLHTPHFPKIRKMDGSVQASRKRQVIVPVVDFFLQQLSGGKYLFPVMSSMFRVGVTIFTRPTQEDGHYSPLSTALVKASK